MDRLVESNVTQETVPERYAISLTETVATLGAGTNDVNDGLDDDGAADNVTTVNAIGVGGSPVFGLDLHPLASSFNSFHRNELTVNNTAGACTANFPTGTTFRFEYPDGTPVTDTNNNGTPDVEIPASPSGWASNRVYFNLIANLPAVTVPGTDGYCAEVTATSDKAPTQSSTTTARLLEIRGGAVDVAIVANNDPNADADALTAGDSSAAALVTGGPGSTQNLSFTITNDGLNPDSFTLNAGGSLLGGALGDLPDGFTITFTDMNGNPISSTPLLDQGEDFVVNVTINFPADMEQAQDDYTYSPSPVDSGQTVWTDGTEPDGAYVGILPVTSNLKSATDNMLVAIDVDAVEDLDLSADNSRQLNAGGSTDFAHILENQGNTVEQVTLTSTMSLPSWSLLTRVDTDGDGAVDTDLGNVNPAGGTIYALDTDDNLVAKTLSGGAFTLNINEEVHFEMKVFAPSTAAAGELVQAVASASFNAGANSVEVTNTLTVIDSALLVVKTADLDADCDGVAESNFTSQLFDVNPGQCTIYQSVVTNAGNEAVEGVTFNDVLPVFTSLQGDLTACMGNAGATPTMSCITNSYTNAIGDDAADFDNVAQPANGWVFSSAQGFTAPNGLLPAGESMTFRYGVVVD